MKKPFVSLLNEFIESNNKKILENPNRFMSLFLDYTQNEYRAETQIFSQFLSSKHTLEINNNDYVDVDFLKTVAERFYQSYKFDKNICELVVFAYARFMGIIDKNIMAAEINKQSVPINNSDYSKIPQKAAGGIIIPDMSKTKPVAKPPAKRVATPRDFNSANKSNITAIIISVLCIIVVGIIIGFSSGGSKNFEGKFFEKFSTSGEVAYVMEFEENNNVSIIEKIPNAAFGAGIYAFRGRYEYDKRNKSGRMYPFQPWEHAGNVFNFYYDNEVLILQTDNSKFGGSYIQKNFK
jgi:hypothetical protein